MLTPWHHKIRIQCEKLRPEASVCIAYGAALDILHETIRLNKNSILRHYSKRYPDKSENSNNQPPYAKQRKIVAVIIITFEI